MFYIIGLGLGDTKDITVKGLEIVKKCHRVYLESFTSILISRQEKEELEAFYGQKLIIADRELVELGADEILQSADIFDIALLVVGDPLGATTHTDLIIRARQKNIKYQIIHNASIISAIGSCGLQLYNFGETISIPFWTESWKPDSFYDKLIRNINNNLHTLCLLDIRVKEPTAETILKKKKQYEPPRFMTVNQAVQQLLEILIRKQQQSTEALPLNQESLCIGVARIGHESQKIVAGSLNDMLKENFGPPLHSLVIPAKKLHDIEHEYLAQFLN